MKNGTEVMVITTANDIKKYDKRQGTIVRELSSDDVGTMYKVEMDIDGNIIECFADELMTVEEYNRR